MYYIPWHSSRDWYKYFYSFIISLSWKFICVGNVYYGDLNVRFHFIKYLFKHFQLSYHCSLSPILPFSNVMINYGVIMYIWIFFIEIISFNYHNALFFTYVIVMRRRLWNGKQRFVANSDPWYLFSKRTGRLDKVQIKSSTIVRRNDNLGKK